MTKDETIRGIATYIDHPNVYMGGPSRDALRKANLIFDYLEIDGLSRQLAEVQRELAEWKRGNRLHVAAENVANERRREAERQLAEARAVIRSLEDDIRERETGDD